MKRLFVILLFPCLCQAQSIGLSVNFSGNGIIHTGIQVQNLSNNLGIYFQAITDETDGCREYFNSFDKDLKHLTGFSGGINYQISKIHPVHLTAGMGRIKCSSYACSVSEDVCSVIFEAGASVEVTRWLDVNCGINSYPMIYSGLTFKLKK